MAAFSQQQQQQQTPELYSARPTIHILNDDVLLRIFDYLHLDDKIKLRRTCFRWKMLLDKQVGRVKSLRMGQFYQGGYNITSGLVMQCHHHHKSNHRQHTGTLFNDSVVSLPADLETQCYSINRYDYLHRALKHCYRNITMLSLGQLKISYRLLIVITHNLPHLEHLELLACASDFPKSSSGRRLGLGDGSPGNGNPETFSNMAQNIPSIESFNSQQRDETYSMLLYNQHHDEQVNMEQRLARSTMVKSCELVKEAKSQNYWPNMRHLLVKDCNLLNEFSLSIILAITSHTLDQLTVESNQYLTGEFLNYCGPQLQILKVKHCPLLQVKFLEDLVKIRQFLAPPPPTSSDQNPNSQQSQQSNQKTQQQINANQSSSSPQPIDTSMLRNFRNSNQAIYCTL